MSSPETQPNSIAEPAVDGSLQKTSVQSASNAQTTSTSLRAGEESSTKKRAYQYLASTLEFQTKVGDSSVGEMCLHDLASPDRYGRKEIHMRPVDILLSGLTILILWIVAMAAMVPLVGGALWSVDAVSSILDDSSINTFQIVGVLLTLGMMVAIYATIAIWVLWKLLRSALEF